VLTQAFSLLDRLLQVVAKSDYHGWEQEIQLLMVIVLHAKGKIRLALKRLGQLLAQTEAEGFIRLFADEGNAMAHLLSLVAPYTTASPSYIQTLKEAALLTPGLWPDTKNEVMVFDQPLLDPLSIREQEILSLLVQGFSNQFIADHLVISLHTVKIHVRHILAKLGVTNRTQAVVRARELHLIQA
jgi:LuxR family maltose regulon positive regulatory protein